MSEVASFDLENHPSWKVVDTLLVDLVSLEAIWNEGAGHVRNLIAQLDSRMNVLEEQYSFIERCISGGERDCRQLGRFCAGAS